MSRIARPTSMQSIRKPTKHRTDESFACNRHNLPTKRSFESFIKVGQKVLVSSLGLTGTVRFFGETRFKPNESWVGIELDIKGAGKNDGCIQGVRYFTCSPNTGLFVTVNKVAPYHHSEGPLPKPTKFAANSQLIKPSKSTTPQAIRPSKSTHANLNSFASTKSTLAPKRTKSTLAPKPTKSTHALKSIRSAYSIKSDKSTTTPLKSAKRTSVPQSAQRISDGPQPTKSTSPPTTKPRGVNTPPANAQTPKKSQSTATARRSLSCSTSLSEKTRGMIRSKTSEPKALKEQSRESIAWERLLSAKESYAIQVQEKEGEIGHLRRALEDSRMVHERMRKEREAAVSRAAMSVDLEHQIDRLEHRCQTLTTERSELQKETELLKQHHAAQVASLLEKLTDRDRALATVEKDYAEVRKANVDAVRSCEQVVEQLKREHQEDIRQKDQELDGLRQAIERLRQEQYQPTPEENEHDLSHRQQLETQLELTLQALDHERKSMEVMMSEVTQLKDEIKHLHHLSATSRLEYHTIKSQLAQEIEDKRRIMEELDTALEVQNRLEEENERLRLSLTKAQHDMAELLKRLSIVEKQNQNANDPEATMAMMEQLREENERLRETLKGSEQECVRLMDELLAFDQLGQEASPWEIKVDQLKAQVGRERKRYKDMEWTLEQKIERLNKELVDLESLVENKVLNETELEERLEHERMRVGQLEVRLKEMERQTMIPTPTSPVLCHLGQKSMGDSYCEMCEVYGHDLMLCTALNDLSIGQLKDERGKFYCVNCDVFDTHSTDQCPNRDETF
ncbi:hypothetical protein G6F62_003213 [Rhizopus arrhizus]|nr:hypothetical protein G6F62_003213 [Rhizopus arrhizus]